MIPSTDLQLALGTSQESATVEFKSNFDSNSPAEWLEILKDIVAQANSGGGFIFIGVNDDGSLSGADIQKLLSIDPADITNKIHKYTGNHFHAFEITECEKVNQKIGVIAVRASRIPLVFSAVGNYEVSPGKQKNVFSLGTVYFRHGAKSEPGNSEDLRLFMERELESIRHAWLSGISKVVEAPTGSRIAILPPETQPSGPSGVLPIRLTDDPNVQSYYAVPIDSTHPYRQKEVIKAVNVLLGGSMAINTHDILCVRRAYSIQKNINFCYTQNYATPRYSQAFVGWIVEQYNADATFFQKAKETSDALKEASNLS